MIVIQWAWLDRMSQVDEGTTLVLAISVRREISMRPLKNLLLAKITSVRREISMRPLQNLLLAKITSLGVGERKTLWSIHSTILPRIFLHSTAHPKIFTAHPKILTLCWNEPTHSHTSIVVPKGEPRDVPMLCCLLRHDEVYEDHLAARISLFCRQQEGKMPHFRWPLHNNNSLPSKRLATRGDPIHPFLRCHKM